MPPIDRSYCRNRAEKCERLAANAKSDEIREIMTYLANRWRTLEEQVETRRTPGKPQPAFPSS
jgi:hypothetical protein